MRIALLIPELLREGGGERQAVYLAKELQQTGHEVVVYTLAHDPRRCYPGVCARLRIVVAGRHPLARLSIPSRRFRDYLDMRHLARRVRGPVDVLNPHHWPPHWAAVWAARRISPQPAVVWMCNDPPWSPERSPSGIRRLTSPLRALLRRALRWHDLRATRQVSRIVVLSEYAKGLVDAAYGSDCTVVRSGVDFQSLQLDDPEQAAELRRRYGISPGAFLLLSLGILMPHRRLEDALAGVAAAAAEGHDIHFLIVGSPSEYPDYAERLRVLARHLGMDGRVTFAGAVPESRLPLCYHACDAFMFPNENQTWSLAVTEAMACGKPVIVSKGAAVQEILEDGKTAFLVPPRRPDLVAAALKRLIDNPDLKESVARAGHCLVVEALSWDKYAGDMIGIFKEAVEEEKAKLPEAPPAIRPEGLRVRRMRIAYVTPEVNHKGATQSCTATLIESVSRRHDVTVFSTGIDGLRSRGVVRWVRIPSLARPFPALFRYLTFLLFSNLALAWDQHVRAHRYDIVHATGGDCFLADIMTAHFCQAERLALARSGRISVDGKGRLSTLDALSQWVYMPIVSAIERLMYGRGRVRTVIAVSRGVGHDIARHYGTKAPILAIPNGVDLQRFHPRNRARWQGEVRTELGIALGDFVLCFVGGDWGRKGLAIAIAALSHLDDQRVSLIVVGSGDQAAYRRLAERYGVAQRVHFVGQTAATERYLAAADAFLFPSSYEAFSLAVLEAAASGLPLLVTRINGTEELVTDGVNGFFVAREPADVAAKVRTLTRDRALAARMGQAARATVENGYDWQTIARRTLDVYEGLAKDVA